MENIFATFCSFGGSSKDAPMQMDGAKFGKFFRDLRLLDKKVTSTDVDIIFAKTKQKSERKINFQEFMVALAAIAEKKYPGDSDAMRRLELKILEGHGPAVSGVTKFANPDITGRMTDTSAYTGTHKERFDEEGKGKGLEGRDYTPKGPGAVPSLVSGQEGYVLGYQNEGTYNKGIKRPEKGNVVDRLTDTSKYTGSHKHRFDAGGQGMGMMGRDLPAKGRGMVPGSVASQAAYVSGYKNEGSYGKK